MKKIHSLLGDKENVETEMPVWQTVFCFFSLYRSDNFKLKLHYNMVGILYLLGMCCCFNKEKNPNKINSSPALHLVLSFLVSLINIFCLVKLNFNCYKMKIFMMLPLSEPDLTSVSIHRWRYCKKAGRGFEFSWGFCFQF